MNTADKLGAGLIAAALVIFVSLWLLAIAGDQAGVDDPIGAMIETLTD